jgi:hypothetical protein
MVLDCGRCISNPLQGGAEAEGFGVGVTGRTHPGASRHPSPEGISRHHRIHVQNSGSKSIEMGHQVMPNGRHGFDMSFCIDKI